ncbi:CCA tRNA nucleotidyltransferase [Tateyamaria omphalii]|uniref:CCA tRNA nucleotidyltransferase n=1 Tax=Tateyamaria omphalii TaxID=299262 RepID=A0A1P8MYJ1_9RHOB|nr:CCA tRNA nucleotidyltransferase [Tateyamaria omphalii]APX13134.1 CCA tRNA nucleotidyltransferase [Tateyamaria omphalii]
MDRPASPRLDPKTAFLTDPAAQNLCAVFAEAGFRALFVGGCVRNAIMSVPISDIDIATDATPDQIIQLCTNAGFRCIPTGIEHGTVTVVAKDHPFEVTTFRKDVETDGRRAVVAFASDVADDARRRDFTMNALYADAEGVITDPVGGLKDAYARCVRFIDDAGQRIREDYLRTLRYFRFSAQYADPTGGWDAEALAGISENLDGLETLSAERVGSEFMKLLSAPDPSPAIAVMHQTGVLARLLPGADPTFLGPLVHLEHLASAEADPLTRLAALGGDAVEDRLRLSRRDRRHLESVRTLSMSSDTAKAIGHLGGEEAGRGAVLLKAAYAGTPIDDVVMRQVDDGAKAVFPISAKDLPHRSGAALGTELKRLKQLWLASDLTKSKDVLLAS